MLYSHSSAVRASGKVACCVKLDNWAKTQKCVSQNGKKPRKETFFISQNVPTIKISLQWPQVTLNWALFIEGTVTVGGTAGVGARLIIRLLKNIRRVQNTLKHVILPNLPLSVKVPEKVVQFFFITPISFVLCKQEDHLLRFAFYHFLTVWSYTVCSNMNTL